MSVPDRPGLRDPADVKLRLLMVCLGNICRSPTAEAVLRQRLHAHGLHERVVVDSAGTGAWHGGDAPDPRSQRHALLRGYDLSGYLRDWLAEGPKTKGNLKLEIDVDPQSFL